FQVIKVEEPGERQAMVMMRGLADTFEKHHKVRVLDEAVEAAVRLSHRYISGRQLPDKSVSVLDTACARVAIGQTANPAAMEDCQRMISQIETEFRVLERESAVGGNHRERLACLATEKEAEQARLAELEKRLGTERGLIKRILELREELEGLLEKQEVPREVAVTTAAAAAPGIATVVAVGDPDALREELGRVTAELGALQGESPL